MVNNSMNINPISNPFRICLSEETKNIYRSAMKDKNPINKLTVCLTNEVRMMKSNNMREIEVINII
jgi:hypothetical protein